MTIGPTRNHLHQLQGGFNQSIVTLTSNMNKKLMSEVTPVLGKLYLVNQ